MQLANSELVLQINRRKRAWMSHRQRKQKPTVLVEHAVKLVVAITMWRGATLRRRVLSIMEEGDLTVPAPTAESPSQQPWSPEQDKAFDIADENGDGVVDKGEYEHWQGNQPRVHWGDAWRSD